VSRSFHGGQFAKNCYVPQTFNRAANPRGAAASEFKSGHEHEAVKRNADECIGGSVTVYETPMVEAQHLNAADRKVAAFQLEVPMKAPNPGWYTCQVNVIDDAGAAFAFPRTQVLARQ
jgi:hypothetical protein